MTGQLRARTPEKRKQRAEAASGSSERKPRARAALLELVADDLHHRLAAGKLLAILNKASGILGAADLEVDIEHEAGWISQFPIERAEPQGTELAFQLAARHTACLAEDQCKRPPQGIAAFNPQAIQFQPRKSALPSS